MKSLLRSIFLMLFLSVAVVYLKADEGMWVVSNLNTSVVGKMKNLGLHLTADQIYSESKPSLKDAVIMFDNDCTGEFVSANGLLFTNHHCGRSRVQQVSSDTKNYIRDGFWASSQKDEIPIKGLTVKYLIRTVNVTSQVAEMLKTKGLRKIQSEMETQYADSINQYTVSLDAYSNGEYYVAVYQVFSDVRLVGVPPESIGNFGGETDNFEWPRHSADFSIFRVYAGTDNRPASYSPDNLPYHPKSFLPISLSGVRDNDFALTIGFPFSTDRYITSGQLTEDLDVKNRATVITKGKYIEVLKKEMDADEAIRLKYSTKNFSAGNSYKLALGTMKLVGLSSALKNKKDAEADLERWINEKPERIKKYGECLAGLKKNYALQHDAKYAHALITGALFSDACVFGTRAKTVLTQLERGGNANQIGKAVESFRQWYMPFAKNYDAATDRKIVCAMLKLLKKEVKAEYLPSVFTIVDANYHGDIDAYVDDLYSKSIFSKNHGVEAFMKNPQSSVAEDPLYIYGISVVDKLLELKKMSASSGSEIRKLTRLYDEGLREKDAGKLKYPDANFSMRLTYGTVCGVNPRDGLIYKSQTTLKGVMEKEDSMNYEFQVSPRLKQLYATQDYGRYADKGTLYTCFLSNTDITGGNSGSPVINGKGELTGLAFDGNWESLAGSIIYESDKNRSINVDIRYVLFIIDKFASATNIIKELTIR